MSNLRRFLALAGALSLAAALPIGAHAAPDLSRVAPIKRWQVRMLNQEPMHERMERKERLRELRAMAREMKRSGRTTLVVRGRRAKPEGTLDDALGARPAITEVPARAATPFGVEAPPRPNVRVNNPASPTVDGAADGQCETSLVAYGNDMVAAWNDGYGFDSGASTTDTQGWGISVDGGLTWTDEGAFPHPTTVANWRWSSDPVVAVNPNTGAFYFAALADTGASAEGSAIGVTKGRFNGSSFTWTKVSVMKAVSSSNNFLDKEWVTVDPATGKVCVSHTEFPNTGSEIWFEYADSALTTWSNGGVGLKISDPAENGYVQGSRPIVGPNGNIYVQYYLIALSGLQDHFKVLKSTDGGVSFPTSGQVDFYSNYGSGAPGFNRPNGIEFAGFAVDRSGGAHNNRLFLSWAESLNWYDDEPNAGTGGNKSEAPGEVGTNDTPATATPAAVGQMLRGSIGSTTDLDYYAITLAAGQSIIVECDSIASSANVTLRLFAPDGTTRLCFTTVTSSDIQSVGSVSYGPVWVGSAPTAGTYYVRVAYNGGTGAYRVKTALATRTVERATDQRDVFVASSDDGGSTWSTPVRVDTEPTGYDGWLPEVAVSNDGHVYCCWYDWRDAAASTGGGQSNVYLARSDDGGATWVQLGATSDATTPWTSVQTNIQPNEGDYQSLFSDGNRVVACWSDGRDGNPNVYMSNWTLNETPTQLALVAASAYPDHVDLSWYVDGAPGLTATVYRRASGAVTWTSEGTVLADGTGELAWTDTQVTPGASYDYRLGVQQNGVETYYGQASVTVPIGVALALEGAHPNPAGVGAMIAFSLPSADPATLSLLDVSGREVETRDVGALGAGRHVLPLAGGRSLPPGVYMVRLNQRGRTLTSRVSIVR